MIKFVERDCFAEAYVIKYGSFCEVERVISRAHHGINITLHCTIKCSDGISCIVLCIMYVLMQMHANEMHPCTHGDLFVIPIMFGLVSLHLSEYFIKILSYHFGSISQSRIASDCVFCSSRF